MSLTSLWTNLFASESSPQPEPLSQAADGIEYDQYQRHGANTSISEGVKSMRTMEEAKVEEEDEDLELKRPPYLHVCFSA